MERRESDRERKRVGIKKGDVDLIRRGTSTAIDGEKLPGLERQTNLLAMPEEIECPGKITMRESEKVHSRVRTRDASRQSIETFVGETQR